MNEDTSSRHLGLTGKIKKLVYIPLIICIFFISTLVLTALLRDLDWYFFNYTLNCLQEAELSDDVVLIDFTYPDRITFRRNLSVFLRKLTKLTEKPLAVGLDIIYQKFEQQTTESNNATEELRSTVLYLRENGIPVIAGYDPEIKQTDYDLRLIGQDSPFTDIGHNLIRIRDGKLHARVSEKINSDSNKVQEFKTFFAVLVKQYVRNLDNSYPLQIENKFNNTIPIRYQKKYSFKTYSIKDEKDIEALNYENYLSKKVVLIGNFKDDYKKEGDFYGLHAIGYAVQLLLDDDSKNERNNLIAFEDRIIVKGIIAIVFSLLEIFIFWIIVIASKRLKLDRFHLQLSLLFSIVLTIVIFIGFVYMQAMTHYIFADFSLVFSGILISGGIFFYFKKKALIIAMVIENETYQIERKHFECVRCIQGFELGYRDFLRNKFINNYGENWEHELCKLIENKDTVLLPKLVKIRDDLIIKNPDNKIDIMNATDLGQLEAIISWNWKYFSNQIGKKDKEWFVEHLKHIRGVRNDIAHNNPVTKERKIEAIETCELLLKMIK